MSEGSEVLEGSTEGSEVSEGSVEGSKVSEGSIWSVEGCSVGMVRRRV